MVKKQMFEPADLFRLKFLQEAKLSPDGKFVAYTISQVDPEKEEEYCTLWLLSLETGKSRQLTSGIYRDTNPAWSPDSKKIAFLSNRAQKPQIYTIPVDGGEAQALTNLKQGVGGGPSWSPNGKYIAFTAGPELEVSDYNIPYRIVRNIYRFDRIGYLEQATQSIFVISAEGGEPRKLTHDQCQNTMPLWSPDGKEILYMASMFPDSHRTYPSLKIVDLEGKVREIADWGYAISCAWLPDSKRIVFIGNPHNFPIGSHHNLWLIDRQGGKPECRSIGFKFQIGGGLQTDMPLYKKHPAILVSNDGNSAYVQVQQGGKVSIYQFSLSGQVSWSVFIDGECSCLPLDANHQNLVFCESTLQNPTDLFIAKFRGNHKKQLTFLNTDLLSKLDLPTVEHLLFPSSDGVEIEGWIMKPSKGSPPYPTIMYIHGGPHSGFGQIFYFDFHMLAAAGYAVLFINQRGSSGYDDEFSTKIIGDWGNLDYKDLMAGVDYVIKKGIADPQRLGCCGLSGGGYLTCWIIGHTNRFKAAVAENPVTNWFSMYGTSDIGPWFVPQEMGKLPHEIPEIYWRCSPIAYAHRCKTPTLLIQAEQDFRCPAEQSEQFYAVLKASGCIVEMIRLPGSFHTGSIDGPPAIRRVQNEALLDWMNRYVLGKVGSRT